jgi:hypothetical protein
MDASSVAAGCVGNDMRSADGGDRIVTDQQTTAVIDRVVLFDLTSMDWSSAAKNGKSTAICRLIVLDDTIV